MNYESRHPADDLLVYRPSLSRRLTRLENKLELAADERHISHAQQMKCEIRELVALRVPENMGRPRNRPRAESRDYERETSLGMGEDDVTSRGGIQQVGKSVWVGRDGEVTVEGWVLEWWENKGYKGYLQCCMTADKQMLISHGSFHSEGSIVTTLFALLMWPILFAPLPGAFETPYQTAPLDLGEDTFAPARAESLEVRLGDMAKTSVAMDMLRQADTAERDRGTWAVGVNWEYSKQDLEEILQCIGGKAMSGICRMLGEEYRHRVSGVPDLMWVMIWILTHQNHLTILY